MTATRLLPSAPPESSNKVKEWSEKKAIDNIYFVDSTKNPNEMITCSKGENTTPKGHW